MAILLVEPRIWSGIGIYRRVQFCWPFLNIEKDVSLLGPSNFVTCNASIYQQYSFLGHGPPLLTSNHRKGRPVGGNVR